MASYPGRVDIETRLDRLESELAIQRLAHEYSHAADKRDHRRFADVWASDGVRIVSREQEFAGVDAICEAVAQQWSGSARCITGPRTTW